MNSAGEVLLFIANLSQVGAIVRDLKTHYTHASSSLILQNSSKVMCKLWRMRITECSKSLFSGKQPIDESSSLIG